MSFLNARLEWREVVFSKILLCGVVVVAISSSLEVINGVMLT